MIPLRFYNPDMRGFYKEDGVTLCEESEDSLEELEQQYQTMCDDFHEFSRHKHIAEAPYRRTRMVNGKEQSYIDYDAWEKADSDGFWQWGLASHNSGEGIEMMQYEIDLKILHLNAREKEQEAKTNLI